ncbi:MAG TPA: hypothetical protein RMH99_05655 [Sandaracinaceae bacterium LLY-WYZ-13_1]|nr:hypothetical protein [Sandaracinaceae bacterium LLY-WYZ-13_1]
MSESAPRPHFSVLGFPVRITPFFFLVVLFLGAPMGQQWTAEVLGKLAIWLVVVPVAILWHELGHALVMRRYGYTPSIVLHGLGGFTTWGKGPAQPRPAQRVWVSLAGPLAGIAVGVVPFVLWLREVDPGHWALRELIEVGWFTTFGWGVLNLVPMLPWDGGHVVESTVDCFAEGRGRKVAGVVTFVVAGLVALLAVAVYGGVNTGTVWIWMLCGLSASNAYRALKPHRAADPRHLDPAQALAAAQRALESAGGPERLVGAVLLRTRAEAWAQLADDLESAVLPQIEAPDRRATALELVAWARLLCDDLDGAREAIARMRPTHDPSPALEASAAARDARFEEALNALEAVDDDEPARALLEAYARTGLGRVDEAMAWIGDDRSTGALIDTALFHAARFDAAAELGAALHARFAHPEDAYNTACSHARAGRPEEGLRWLERAVDGGYDDLAHLEADEDLRDVRALAGYRGLRERLAH